MNPDARVGFGCARRSACLLAFLLGANPHTVFARRRPSDIETAAPYVIGDIYQSVDGRGDVRSLKESVFDEDSTSSEINGLDWYVVTLSFIRC